MTEEPDGVELIKPVFLEVQMIKRCLFVVFIMLSVLIFPVYPQDEDLVERTVLVLDLINYSDQEGELEMIGDLVSDTVSIVLQELGFGVVSGEMWRTSTDELDFIKDNYLEKGAAMEFAASLGADVLVNGFFRVEEEEVVIGITAYDIFTGLIAVGSSSVGPAGVGIYDTIDETAVAIAGKIREALKPLPASIIEVQREKIRVETKVLEEIVQLGEKVRVTFYSRDEGAQLVLADGSVAGIIEEGKAVYEAHPDTSLLVSIQKENHYTKEETYSIPAEDTEIELPVLFRKSRWDLSLFYTVNYPLGIGAGYRYHIISEYIYLYALGGALLPSSILPARCGSRCRLFYPEPGSSAGHRILPFHTGTQPSAAPYWARFPHGSLLPQQSGAEIICIHRDV